MAEQLEPPSSSSKDRDQQRQGPTFSGIPDRDDDQMFPVFYPGLFPTPYSNTGDSSGSSNRGAGVYAVPVASPHWGPAFGLPPTELIPLSFNIPTRPIAESGGTSDHGNEAQPLLQPDGGQQRQAAFRRIQIVFHIDLVLIFKLAAVIFLFNQDGSRQRLVVLMACAVFLYLYQTGALAPLIRWLSQNMQVAAAPNRRPARAMGPENAPLIPRQDENGAGGGLPEGEAANPAEDGGNGNQTTENGNAADGGGGGGENAGNRRWGLFREIQMIVFGFITSLLPGFHNVD